MRTHLRLFVANAAVVLALTMLSACDGPTKPDPLPVPVPISVTIQYSGPVPNYTADPEFSPILDVGQPGSSGQLVPIFFCEHYYGPPNPSAVQIVWLGSGNRWSCTFVLNKDETYMMRVADGERGRAEGTSGWYTAVFSGITVIGGGTDGIAPWVAFRAGQ